MLTSCARTSPGRCPTEGGSDAREDTTGSPEGTPDVAADPAAYSVGEAIAIVHLPSTGQVRPAKGGP